MTEDVVICAEGLGKKYMIGHAAERERYVALRDVLTRGARNLWRKTADMTRGRAIVAGDTVEEFWALKDVSFEVKRSEVLGIIGRNGAGKSTLLKILSRITEPSEGRVTINGRVASLLEVGTGFHPELTGRENIYLNGAILGMTRAEIRRKFDEIVDFAEVEKFLDTPVKRYSSGMYIRLAFAVAAHLEPEILVVDEVLAVGDAEFQKKCLGKMSEIAGGGRTVLFVSHNMAAIRTLCTKSLLLARGSIKISGMPNDIIGSYASQSQDTIAFSRPPKQSEKPMVVGVTWVRPAHQEVSAVNSGIDIEIVISACHPTTTSIDLRLKDGYSNPVGFGSLGAFQSKRPVVLNSGINKVLLNLSADRLAMGEYHLSVDLTHPHVEFFDRVEDCIRFQISSDPVVGSGYCLEQRWGYGCIALPLHVKAPPALSLSTNEDQPGQVAEADGWQP
jgi:lipopolysaccharide transport system ATP-binding protein